MWGINEIICVIFLLFGMLYFYLCNACMLRCFSRVPFFVTLWTVDHQAPLSMGFSQEEYWSRLPFPSLIYAIQLIFIYLWAYRQTVCGHNQNEMNAQVKNDIGSYFCLSQPLTFSTRRGWCLHHFRSPQSMHSYMLFANIKYKILSIWEFFKILLSKKSFPICSK